MTQCRSRRAVLGGLLGTTAALALTSCDKIGKSETVRQGLQNAEPLTESVQRALANKALAPEFPESAIARHFKSNGTNNPDKDEYNTMATNGFADWKLQIGGLVNTPLSLSLADLRAAPSRTQVTRHDCVEGWSAIAKWKGARLGAILDRAGLKPDARFLAFMCADTLEETLDNTGDYYETIAIADAYHEQTILAYDMNDAALPVENGAPIRLRLERQLGYKMAKYVMRIDAIADFASLGQGKGGFWEDRGYQWYAGI